jgi:hypothetical protein
MRKREERQMKGNIRKRERRMEHREREERS